MSVLDRLNNEHICMSELRLNLKILMITLEEYKFNLYALVCIS